MLTARPNAEGAYRQLAAKTPGRALSRNENAHRGAPATVHGKGKNVLLQTPFNPTTKRALFVPSALFIAHVCSTP